MRRITMMTLLLAMVAGVALASGPWNDGSYTAEADSFSHGWKNTVRIVVSEGYIVDAHFDALPEEGEKPKYLASVQGEYGMVANSDAEERWWVQMDRAVAELLIRQDPSQLTERQSRVDAIAGVSVTIMPHFELAAEALAGERR